MALVFLGNAGFSTYVGAGFCLIIFASLSYALYCVFFHPLAKMPGPWLPRISVLPAWYHTFKGDRHVWLWQLMEIYGDRVRIAPNVVIFGDPGAFKEIYGAKSNVKRSLFYPAQRRRMDEVHTLGIDDPVLHSQRRKLLNQCFHEKSLRSASKFIFKHIDRWIELQAPSGDDWGHSINISHEAHSLLFDIAGDLSFGRSFETKEPGTSPMKDVPDMMEQDMKHFYPMFRSPMLPLVMWLKPRGLDDLLLSLAPQKTIEFLKFIVESVTARVQLQRDQKEKPESEKRLDMFHWLSESKNDAGEPAYVQAELQAEAELLLVAGTDTSSTAISATLWYLSLPSQAHRLTRLVREIRSTFDSADEIVHGPKLASCHYLMACIEEAMRLCPPVSADPPRVVCRGGITIQDDFYPEGTVVGVSNYTAGRREATYSNDAGSYRPERWIVDEDNGVSKEDVARARSGVWPFLTGPGQCPGKNLAILEIQATVGRTLWHYDMRREPGSTLGGGRPELGWGQRDPESFQLYDAYVAYHVGPMVQFRKRTT